MHITFDSTTYSFNHGASPKGRGHWAFSMLRNPDVSNPAHVFWAQGTFTEAKRAARTHYASIARLGLTAEQARAITVTVYVLP